MACFLVYLVLLSTTLASPAIPQTYVVDLPSTCTSFCVNNFLSHFPIACPRADPSPSPDISPSIDPNPSFNKNYRSTLEIVWSCLSIIFACTWVCVHPNVTGYDTTTLQRIWRRTKLFALAIFAPELLAVFAWFQWKGARELHKAFRDKAVELEIPLSLEAHDVLYITFALNLKSEAVQRLSAAFHREGQAVRRLASAFQLILETQHVQYLASVLMLEDEAIRLLVSVRRAYGPILDLGDAIDGLLSEPGLGDTRGLDISPGPEDEDEDVRYLTAVLKLGDKATQCLASVVKNDRTFGDCIEGGNVHALASALQHEDETIGDRSTFLEMQAEPVRRLASVLELDGRAIRHLARAAETEGEAVQRLALAFQLEEETVPLGTDASSSEKPASGSSNFLPMINHENPKACSASWVTRLLLIVEVPIRVTRRLLSLYEVDPTETAWTLTHAHFIQMGGVAFVHPSTGYAGFKEPGVKGRKGIECGWTDDDIRNFFLLRLTTEAILDKSKGSAFAKGIVIMQVLWFVTQTAARVKQGLPTIHLEVVCLAYTVFSVGMYMCWWDKPLDVEHPLEVSGKPGVSQDSGRESSDWLEALIGGLDALPIGAWAYALKTRLYPSVYCYHEPPPHSFVDDYFSRDSQRFLGGAFTFALSFTSASFGAMHMLGWPITSPSLAEHVIWRVSSLVLMCYPIFPIVINPLVMYVRGKLREDIDELWAMSWAALSISGAMAYVAARFLLLILPFIELRNLPPLAHQTVSWADFLPHI